MVQVAVKTRCLICGHDILKDKGYSTGYVFTESGKKLLYQTRFCSEKCMDKFIEFFANPVFQNEKACELFVKKHPNLYARIRGKPKIFLEV
jgi:ribosomal protein L24E